MYEKEQPITQQEITEKEEQQELMDLLEEIVEEEDLRYQDQGDHDE